MHGLIGSGDDRKTTALWDRKRLRLSWLRVGVFVRLAWLLSQSCWPVPFLRYCGLFWVRAVVPCVFYAPRRRLAFGMRGGG